VRVQEGRRNCMRSVTVSPRPWLRFQVGFGRRGLSRAPRHFLGPLQVWALEGRRLSAFGECRGPCRRSRPILDNRLFSSVAPAGIGAVPGSRNRSLGRRCSGTKHTPSISPSSPWASGPALIGDFPLSFFPCSLILTRQTPVGKSSSRRSILAKSSGTLQARASAWKADEQAPWPALA